MNGQQQQTNTELTEVRSICINFMTSFCARSFHITFSNTYVVYLLYITSECFLHNKYFGNSYNMEHDCLEPLFNNNIALLTLRLSRLR